MQWKENGETGEKHVHLMNETLAHMITVLKLNWEGTVLQCALTQSQRIAKQKTLEAEEFRRRLKALGKTRIL